MNHDADLKQLGLWLKIIMVIFDEEIKMVDDPKHHAELIQELDKAKHFMIKMTECFDSLNCWFSAFGSPEEKQ